MRRSRPRTPGSSRSTLTSRSWTRTVARCALDLLAGIAHRPETASAALACVELAREILVREISDDDPVIDERLDRVHAVELLTRVADWANERAVHELAAEVREARP